MHKVGKLLSATVVASTLVLGSSASYITTNSSDVQAAEQVQKWGHGEGGASGANTESSANLKAETPWYNYEGYTTYDPSFTQDYNFVRALKYDNVSIDGYKVDPSVDNDYDYSKEVYDTTVDFNSDKVAEKIDLPLASDFIILEINKKITNVIPIIALNTLPTDPPI
ncbi:immunodominant staphylococcal antigen IsaB family protein [Staphylococcus equorum]|uniref:immunodominant staphylococcal antigen IsaB family protein n=1 Tax=Staphylococcus equorum TaxID=246432 RepID=UPI003F7B1A6E